MKSLCSFILLVFVSLPVFGQNFEPIVKPIGFAEKIVIRGFKGNLQIVPTDTESLRVEARKTSKGEFDQWTVQFRQKTNVVELIVKGPSEQEDWEQLRANKNIPEFDIKVTAPQKDMEIFWGEGKIVADHWNANMSIQMTDGDMKVTKSKGNLMLHLIKGRLKVAEHQGNIETQTFKGQATIDKTKGSIVVDNHSATYTIDEHNGPLEFRNHSGSLADVKSTGSINIRNVSGVISIKDFSGSLEGDFTKGSLSAKMTNVQNVTVNSEEAAITLDVPEESGAMVSLRSQKGDLRSPDYLEKNEKGLWIEHKGRLKGKEQGNIKILSKYGDIVLK